MDTSDAEGAREAVERDWALERGLARVSEVDGLREEKERVGWVSGAVSQHLWGAIGISYSGVARPTQSVWEDRVVGYKASAKNRWEA